MTTTSLWHMPVSSVNGLWSVWVDHVAKFMASMLMVTGWY